MRLIPLALGMLPVLACHQALAAQKTVTFFLDGARVEQEVAVSNGFVDVPLPDNFTPGSLRVKPVGGGAVIRVELVPATEDRRKAREIARMKERRGELQDRMAALSRREEIFSAAVKSQSGKTPRKTKANPDPLGTLQKGTDFALGQMEAVYRSKRACQKALDEVERDLAAAAKGVASAKIWAAGPKIRVGYLLRDERWVPSYDLRFPGDGPGELLLHAKLPAFEKGVQYRVSRGSVTQDAAAEPVRGDFQTLSRYPLALVAGAAPGEAARFVFAAVEPGLPPGEAALFWRGEYLGSGTFSGGGATEFSVGK